MLTTAVLTTVPLTVRTCEGDATVEVVAAADTPMAEVCLGLGLPPQQVHVDGRPVQPDAPLLDTLAPGAVLTPSRPSDVLPTDPGTTIAVAGGLHAGTSVELTPGVDLIIGRSADADLRVPCPTVSPRHAVVTWSGSRPLLTDVGAANGIVGHDGTRHQAVPLDRIGEVRLGAARLRLASAPADQLTLPPPEPPDGRRTLDRPLVPASPSEPPPLSAPPAPTLVAGQSPFSWALFLGPLVIGALMAMLLGPLMAVFAVLSPVMMLASWCEGRRRQRAGRQREHRRLRGELAAFALALDVLRDDAAARRRADHPDPAEVVRRARTPTRTLWGRRPGHRCWMRVRVGTGRTAWTAPLSDVSRGAPAPQAAALLAAADHLDDVPVTVAADEVAVVGLTGPLAVTHAAIRAMLIDAATHQGPADLGVVIDTDRPDAWAWSRWLPHHGPLDPDASRHLLVVTDRTSALRPGGISRVALDRTAGPTTLLVAADRGTELPDRCDVVIRALDEVGTATVEGVEIRHQATGVLLDGLDPEVAEAAARALARLRDPEHEQSSGLPGRIRLSEVVGEPLEAASVGRRWAHSDPSRLDTVLGIGAGGPYSVDLVASGPHVLVGGTTGAGKSELLRTLVAGLASSHPPDQVAFVLVDYKGGSAFDACAELPHTVGLVTDLDGRLGDRAIRSLEAEIRRREQVLRETGRGDIASPGGHGPRLARLVVVVDEFAALARDLPDVLDALIDVARRGRSLGIHLVLATQRPAGVVSDQIRTNTNLRIALRMVDPGDSADVIGDGSATRLPPDAPGRAVVRGGQVTEDLQVACVSLPTVPPGVQVRWLDDDLNRGPVTDDAAAGPTDLEAIVAATKAAWAGCIEGSPVRAEALRRPWLEPLPVRLELADATAEAVEPCAAWPLGQADDPDRQRRVDLAWHPDEGPLLVFGMPGSGCTTALRTLVQSGAHRLDGSQLHIYVVGAAAEWGPAIGGLPQVGGIVEPDDLVRLERLLDLVRAAARAPDPVARLLLVLDGIRPFLDAVDRHGGVSLVDEVLALLTRPAPGLAVAASADRVGSVPGALMAVSTRKLCLRLPDPYDYATFGLRPVEVRTMPAGRGFDASTGLELQVAATGPRTHRMTPDGAGPGPDPLDVLPTEVRRIELPAPAPDHRRWATALGLTDHPREPAMVHLDRGEHLLVTGPSGSGRSCALAAMAGTHGSAIFTGAPRSPLRTGSDTTARWCPIDALDPDRWRRSDQPLLLLVDDADLVDDTDGCLADLLADPGSVRVVAAVHHDRIRARYQHWTVPLTTGRLGLALQPRPQDAELWASAFPGRPTAGWPPGRGYLIEHGRARLVQVVAP